MDGKDAIVGTFGELWLNGEYVAEAYGLQAKFKKNKEKVPIAGKMANDTVVTSKDGTGSVKIHPISSRMAILLSEEEDARFTLVSKLKAPKNHGAERVAIKNLSFDEEIVANWEVGKIVDGEYPFTFTEREYLDLIRVR